MIVAEHLLPFDRSRFSDSIAKGSVTDIAHFCIGEERIESFAAGTVMFLFAEPEHQLGYDEHLLLELGELFPSWNNLKVAVLGRLITSSNEEYNEASLAELLTLLIKCGHYPVLLSSCRRYAEVACRVKQEFGGLNVAFISPVMGADEGRRSTNLIGLLQIIEIKPLETLSVIATQSYFFDDAFAARYERTYFQHIRLGNLRESVRFAEPPLRDANLLLVDTSAIRHSDFSSSACCSPNGLYAEEACQLMRYAGFSDNLSMTFIGGFDPLSLKRTPVDVMLVAQSIWHLLDGLAHRRPERVGITSFPSKQFYVELGEQEPLTLNFLRSEATGRWWLFIPSTTGEGRWIACDAEDYDNAKHHEMPLRWILAYRVE